MYWRDDPRPHLHAFYGGGEALIEIETGDVLAGRLPMTALRLIRDWVLLHRVELMANWEHARLQEPLEQVPGADVE